MLHPSFEGYRGVGLGFQRLRFGGHGAVGHFGGDSGYRSLLVMIPEKKIGLVLLGNCDFAEDYRQEILVEFFFDRSSRCSRPSTTVTPSSGHQPMVRM